jgi:hypothetical protein
LEDLVRWCAGGAWLSIPGLDAAMVNKRPIDRRCFPGRLTIDSVRKDDQAGVFAAYERIMSNGVDSSLPPRCFPALTQGAHAGVRILVPMQEGLQYMYQNRSSTNPFPMKPAGTHSSVVYGGSKVSFCMASHL